MISTNKLFFAILICLIFNSCEKRESAGFEIKSYFVGEFPDKEVNLSKKLGNKIILFTNEDTTHLSIRYDKSTKTNYIVGQTNEEEYIVFQGKIYKYKGLYYFCSPVNDSSYWISPVKIKKDYIQGLNSDRDLMYDIDNILDTTKYHPLLKLKKYPSSVEYALIPDKKILSAFYKPLVVNFPEYHYINEDDVSPNFKEEESAEEQSGSEKEDFESLNDNNGIIKKYYPNPVTDILNIEVNRKATYQIKVFNANQIEVLNKNFNDNKTSIQLDQQPNGIYYVLIHSNELKQKETFKIVIQK